MNVEELKELIDDLPDDMEVILQQDAEGGGYSPLHGGWQGIYIPDDTWWGEAYDDNLTADEVCMEENKWEEIKSKPRVLVLRPVN